MRAVCLDAPGPVAAADPLRACERPAPEPGPGEIRIAVAACGVCHTDLHIAEGEVPAPIGRIPGHQVVGAVEARGVGAERFAVGDRVGVPWLHHTCGRCAHCARGEENLCEQARFTGRDADGGFAERMTVGEAFAVPIPEAIETVAAAPLLCAGIIGYRALRLAELQPGERLGLYGFGASAHLAIQLARHRGCEVFVFTRRGEHQEQAKRLGAAWVGSSARDGGDDPPEPLDRAVTFAPVGWLVPRALSHLRRGGTLAINAVHMSPIPEMAYETLYWERTVRTVANATRQDAEDFLALAAEIPIRPETTTFPLEEANEVLRRLKRSEIDGAAVLVP